MDPASREFMKIYNSLNKSNNHQRKTKELEFISLCESLGVRHNYHNYILSEGAFQYESKVNKARIEKAAENCSVTKEEIIKWLKQLKGFEDWALGQMLHIENGIPDPKIRDEADVSRCKEPLEKWNALKSAKRPDGTPYFDERQKNISNFTHISQIIDLIEQVTGKIKERKGSKQQDPTSLPGVTEVGRYDGNKIIYHITNVDSLAKLGIGTEWCTRASVPGNKSQEYAQIYINNHGSQYQVRIDGEPLWQLNPNFSEFKDVKDKECRDIGERIKVARAIGMLKDTSNVDQTFLDKFEQHYTFVNRSLGFRDFRLPNGKLFGEFWKKEGLGYILESLLENRTMPEIEQAVLNSKDLGTIILYANVHSLENVDAFTPWIEDAIKNHPEKIFSMGMRFTAPAQGKQGRKFIDMVESAFSQNGKLASEYAKKCIDDRWSGRYAKQAEKAIATSDPATAASYAKTIDRRWPREFRQDAEKTILQSVEVATTYYTTKNIFPEDDENRKQRWLELEAKIMTLNPKEDADYGFDIYMYAHHAFKGPWQGPAKDAAEAILAVSTMPYTYASNCLPGKNGRPPGPWQGPNKEAAEQTIAYMNPFDYAIKCLNDRWPESSRQVAEQNIIKLASAEKLVEYAEKCIKGRWNGPLQQQAEEIIMGDAKASKSYINFLNRIGKDLEALEIQNNQNRRRT